MLTRTLNLATASLGLTLATLFTQPASATEELVVYGTATNAVAESSRAALKSDMMEYVRRLNRELKIVIDKDVKQVATPKLQLALQEVTSRG